MKKTVLTGAAALTLFDIAGAAPALAQQPANGWGGGYAGFHIGYREGDGDFTGGPFTIDVGGGDATVPGRSDNFNTDSVIGGVHGGFNALIGPILLIGFEGDFSYGSGDDKVTVSNTVANQDGTAFVVQNSSIELGWQATLRGRIGLVQGPWLFFATGGVAFLEREWRDTYTATPGSEAPLPTFASSRDDDTLIGWVAGGGVANQVTSNMIARLDVLYEDFGSESVPFGTSFPLGTAQTGRLEITAYKIRFGVSFKIPPN